MDTSWKELLHEEAQKPYYQQLSQFLIEEGKQHIIYPKHKDVFNAFKYCPLSTVKVVLLGQDAYINPGQAHGLSFSVLPGIDIPPSLRNIFKELKNDLGIDPPNHGCLIDWARQGVLLLNSVLTVRQGQSGSHRNMGWEQLTDRVIGAVNGLDRPIVYLLWGRWAKDKKILITNEKHCVLEASHPSPLSAHSGWFGSKPFSRTNDFLTQHNIQPIDWRIQ